MLRSIGLDSDHQRIGAILAEVRARATSEKRAVSIGELAEMHAAMAPAHDVLQ
jgi:hypothetical protein